MGKMSVYGCIFIGVLATVWLLIHSGKDVCVEDLVENTTLCSPVCSNGSFALPGMQTCHPWLTCSAKISIKKMIGYGTVKRVYLGQWEGYYVAVSELSSSLYEDDFKENLHLFSLLGPNSFTAKFVGYCNKTIITQYYELGNALMLNYHLHHLLKKFNTIAIRFKLCIDYVAILNFLHSNPAASRVMCDSNTLEKTLSQYLLSNDLQLIINDLDALPKVGINKKGVICGKKQLYGSFVAPEQLWPFEEEFSYDRMPTYDEKSDIWKIPDVCNWFLGNSTDADILKFRLYFLHKRCKSEDPTKRPKAEFIREIYQNTWNEFYSNA